MATIVGGVFTSHGPFTTLGPEFWHEHAAKRSFRDDVPAETEAEMVTKAARLAEGRSQLRRVVTDLHPDVLVVFGDDQLERYSLANFPSIAVFTGSEFSGSLANGLANNVAGTVVTVKNSPDLATAILYGLLGSGFDPSLATDQGDTTGKVGHAIMRPLEYFTDLSTPTVPIFLNTYFAPQLTATRCMQIGKTVGEAIRQCRDDLRVVVVGSGGMWHTPDRPHSYIDEAFDRRGLEHFQRGTIEEWAHEFDEFVVDSDDDSQQLQGKKVTGLPGIGGPQFGTRETCNWIAAAATMPQAQGVVVDYVPVYSSPIGNAFGYCITASTKTL